MKAAIYTLVWCCALISIGVIAKVMWLIFLIGWGLL